MLGKHSEPSDLYRTREVFMPDEKMKDRNQTEDQGKGKAMGAGATAGSQNQQSSQQQTQGQQNRGQQNQDRSPQGAEFGGQGGGIQGTGQRQPSHGQSDQRKQSPAGLSNRDEESIRGAKRGRQDDDDF